MKFIEYFKKCHPDILLNIVENTEKDKISPSDLYNQPIAGKGSNYSCYTSNISRLFQRNINPKIVLKTTNDLLIITWRRSR